MKRRLSILLIIAVLFVSFNTIVSAHSSSQEGILMKQYHANKGKSYIGGEDVGWWIAEDEHSYTNVITYRFYPSDIYLTDTYKNYVRQGAAKWSGTVTISEVTSTGMGTVLTYNNPNTSTIAQCTSYITDGNGHFTYWEMQLNRSKTQSVSTCAHEFGHTIGLKDLYNEAMNGTKLMYFQKNNVLYPTSSDKWGAKVITGTHTSHSWGYKSYSATASGNRHVKYCTSCNGYASIAYCVYNTQNVCKICGVPKGAGAASVNPIPILQ